MASLADAEEAFRSTSAKANFQRLTRLLMCGGLRLLRETFDSIHSPADLPLRLGDPTIEAQLKGARLTLSEWNCLYPSTGKYGKSTDFDITLTFRLLRTICNLTPPPGPRGWDSLPNSSDHSLEADLVRIKYYRNEVYGHNKTMEITNTEFDQLWGKISEALIRIAAAISHEKKDEWKKSIDDYLHKPLTPAEERYIEQLNNWYKEDMDIKTEVEKLTEEIKTMKEGFAMQSRRHPADIQNVVPTSKECDPVDKQRVESLLESRAPVDLREPGSPQLHHFPVMASSEKDEDTTAKGKELWKALKRDPLDKEQIKLLLQLGAPVNFREPDSRKTRFQTGRTLLHYVVFEVDGDQELLEMLLKHGADTNLSDSYDFTPLHLAAEKGNLRAVRKLVDNPYSPADPNKQNRSGETPAQVAQRKQQENVLHYLLNDNTNDQDVSSDGDGNVHVSTSAGSSVTVNSPGGTVHVMVGDGNKMSISK